MARAPLGAVLTDLRNGLGYCPDMRRQLRWVLLVLAFTAQAQARPQARPTKTKVSGKVAVFPVLYDDGNGLTGQLRRLMHSRGLEVSTDVRRVDTPEQLRELATVVGLVAYIDAELVEDPTTSRLTVVVHSGYTGKKVAVVTFKGTTLELRDQVEDKLWLKIGPAIERACADASKPRKRDRDPLVVEAGTPLANR